MLAKSLRNITPSNLLWLSSSIGLAICFQKASQELLPAADSVTLAYFNTLQPIAI